MSLRKFPCLFTEKDNTIFYFNHSFNYQKVVSNWKNKGISKTLFPKPTNLPSPP